MTEVRNEIIERLKTIGNEDFLNSILHYMRNVDDKGVFQLTDSQKKDIQESIDQIERGEYRLHEDVISSFLK